MSAQLEEEGRSVLVSVCAGDEDGGVARGGERAEIVLRFGASGAPESRAKWEAMAEWIKHHIHVDVSRRDRRLRACGHRSAGGRSTRRRAE